ncbi:MAG TPA: histidinol-phosphate transaminase, partial [Kiritimatiellia bacterium]
NENALGPSPLAVDAMRRSAERMHLYPDGDSFYLCRALAKKLGVQHDQIFFGHGSNEIIALLGHVYLEKGVNIVASEFAFVIYRLVASLYEAVTVSVPARDYGHDPDAMLRAITPETRLVFLANPNNPTGTMLDAAALDRFMAKVPGHVVVVIDEAYIELLPAAQRPDSLKYVREGRPVFVLRTFSKTYGLAGLRVGYAIAPPEGIKLLHRVRQPFNVNAMAQAAAVAALEDDAHVDRTRAMVKEGLAQLARAFDEMGLAYVPSAVNFVLVKVGRGREVFDALRRLGVIVRPVDNYGLPEFIRVTVGTQAENERFLAALKAVSKRPVGDRAYTAKREM